MMASFVNDQDYEGTWMESYYQEPINKYILSFYWACNTITTVGYGDISGTNDIEMAFCTIVEVFGVVGFAFASSSLTSILTNYDQTNAGYQAKLETLNNIYKRYKLPFRLFLQLKKSIGFENVNDSQETNEFIQELPYRLRMEVALYIYEEKFNDMKFLKQIQQPSFLSWLCPLLKPVFLTSDQYISMEGDDIKGVYFMMSGQGAYVLPVFANTAYITVAVGDNFGLSDILGAAD